MRRAEGEAVGPRARYDDTEAELLRFWCRLWPSLLRVVIDAWELIWHGGTGNCERRRLLCIISDQGMPAES